jgi:hypothetical protein
MTTAELRVNSFPARIFLVALVLRLIPVLLTRQLGIGLDDMFQYDMLARSLASGNGFRWYAPPDLARLTPYLHLDVMAHALDPRGVLTTFRAPLYPAFVAMIYAAFGIDAGRFFAVRLAQAALGAFLAPVTYFAGLLMLHGRNVAEGDKPAQPIAKVAAWVVSLYPTLVIFPLALATENLFFPLVLASGLVLLKLAQESTASEGATPRPRLILAYALLAGMLMGLAALTRSVIVPFACIAVIWIGLSLRRPGPAMAAALAFVLTVTPWIVRNSLLSHRLTGIESSMSYNLYVGYHPQSTGTFTFGPSLDLLSIIDDRARDQMATQRALDFIREDPQRFPILAFRRLGYFFNLELRAFTYFYVNDFLGPIARPLLVLILSVLGIPFIVVSLSAALGAASLPRRTQTVLLVLLFGSYLLPHVLILSEERFHLTMIPFLAICAANGWARGIGALKSRYVAALLVFIVCGLLIGNWCFELARDGQVLGQMLGPNGNQLYFSY